MDCEHERTQHIDYLRVCQDCHLVLGEVAPKIRGPGIEHVAWDQRSHYTFLPPVRRKDKVLESYTLSLPHDLREDLLKEFKKDDGKKCAKKKKLILAKYVVACQHSLRFDLDKEVKKLGGQVRISAE